MSNHKQNYIREFMTKDVKFISCHDIYIEQLENTSDP